MQSFDKAYAGTEGSSHTHLEQLMRGMESRLVQQLAELQPRALTYDSGRPRADSANGKSASSVFLTNDKFTQAAKRVGLERRMALALWAEFLEGSTGDVRSPVHTAHADGGVLSEDDDDYMVSDRSPAPQHHQANDAYEDDGFDDRSDGTPEQVHVQQPRRASVPSPAAAGRAPPPPPPPPPPQLQAGPPARAAAAKPRGKPPPGLAQRLQQRKPTPQKARQAEEAEEAAVVQDDACAPCADVEEEEEAAEHVGATGGADAPLDIYAAAAAEADAPDESEAQTAECSICSRSFNVPAEGASNLPLPSTPFRDPSCPSVRVLSADV